MSLLNTTVGNYRVTKLLGEGGMGAVYLGEHPVIGRKVAIKVLHSALARDQDIVARFFNEARAIHLIAHPNIVEILDFGQTPDGQPYFIMEFLTGEALSEVVARGPVAASEVGIIANQMCRALAAAHAKGIVHRDLKPHNVQLLAPSEKESGPFVKILDFGVAKILSAPDGSQSVKTRTGSLMGTPLYMSPEQCKGAGLLDHRTDIYSLGVMIYEMLAGRPPFMAEGIGELFAKHMLEEAPSLLDFAPQTPPSMAAAVMKSLNKELDDRFPSMEEFRKGLLGEIEVSSAHRAAPGMKRAPAAGTRPPNVATTMSPQAQSTTLSSATSEIDDDLGDLAPPKKKTGLIIGAGIGLAAAAVIAFVVVGKSGSGSSGSEAAKAQIAAAPAPVAPPPVKTTVTVRFEASPAGAHVFRKSDGADLGAAPLDVKVAHNGPATDYVLRKDGFKELGVTADASEDNTVHVALEKLEAPAALPVATKPEPEKRKASTGGHKASKRKAADVPDEDGLATPSF